MLFVWLMSMHEHDWRMWSGKALIHSGVNPEWCKLSPIVGLPVAYTWPCLTSSLCLFSQVVALSSWSLLRDSIYYTLSVVALIVVSFQRLLCMLYIYIYIYFFGTTFVLFTISMVFSQAILYFCCTFLKQRQLEFNITVLLTLLKSKIPVQYLI